MSESEIRLGEAGGYVRVARGYGATQIEVGWRGEGMASVSLTDAERAEVIASLAEELPEPTPELKDSK